MSTRQATSVGGWRRWAPPFLLFAAALALYSATQYPGVGGRVCPGDSAKFQFLGYVLGLPHGPGFPLYILLNKLFVSLPLPLPIWSKANLLSAFFGALAVVLVYALCLRLRAHRGAALAAAAAAAVGLAHWSQAAETEVYSLNAFFFLAVVLQLGDWLARGERRDLLWALLPFALGFGNHLVTVTLFPAVLWAALLGRGREGRRVALSWKTVGPALAMAAVGALPYLWLWARYRAGAPNLEGLPPAMSGGEFLRYILGLRYESLMFDAPLSEVLGIRLPFFALQLWQQYGPLFLLAAAAGLWLLWREARRLLVLLLLVGAGLLAWGLNYSIYDITVYYIPLYLLLALPMHAALAALLDRLGPGRRAPAAALLVLWGAALLWNGWSHGRAILVRPEAVPENPLLAELGGDAVFYYREWGERDRSLFHAYYRFTRETEAGGKNLRFRPDSEPLRDEGLPVLFDDEPLLGRFQQQGGFLVGRQDPPAACAAALAAARPGDRVLVTGCGLPEPEMMGMLERILPAEAAPSPFSTKGPLAGRLRAAGSFALAFATPGELLTGEPPAPPDAGGPAAGPGTDPLLPPAATAAEGSAIDPALPPATAKGDARSAGSEGRDLAGGEGILALKTAAPGAAGAFPVEIRLPAPPVIAGGAGREEGARSPREIWILSGERLALVCAGPRVIQVNPGGLGILVLDGRTGEVRASACTAAGRRRTIFRALPLSLLQEGSRRGNREAVPANAAEAVAGRISYEGLHPAAGEAAAGPAAATVPEAGALHGAPRFPGATTVAGAATIPPYGTRILRLPASHSLELPRPAAGSDRLHLLGLSLLAARSWPEQRLACSFSLEGLDLGSWPLRPGWNPFLFVIPAADFRSAGDPETSPGPGTNGTPTGPAETRPAAGGPAARAAAREAAPPGPTLHPGASPEAAGPAREPGEVPREWGPPLASAEGRVDPTLVPQAVPLLLSLRCRAIPASGPPSGVAESAAVSELRLALGEGWAVESAGWWAGDRASIRLGGVERAPNLPGLNVVAVIPGPPGRTPEVRAEVFDTGTDPGSGERLAAFIDSLPAGTLVLIAARGDASSRFGPRAREALQRIGGTRDLAAEGRPSYVLAGIKAAFPGRRPELAGGLAPCRLGPPSAPPREDFRPLSAAPAAGEGAPPVDSGLLLSLSLDSLFLAAAR